MANATQSRSIDASRAEKTRSKRLETSIVATARMIGDVDKVFTVVDMASTLHKGRNAALSVIQAGAYNTLCDGQYALLHLIPEGDDRDLMILAGHAAMLADQLPDLVGNDDPHATKVCEGIKAALATISAALAQSWPAGSDTVDPIYPELARSIRSDVLVTEARRAALEAQ